MRIGVLVDQLNTGGVQKVAIKEVSELRKLNYDTVLLVITRTKNMKYYYEFKDKIPIEFITDRIKGFKKILLKGDIGFPFFSFFSPFHVMSALICPDYFREREYDVIIAHGTYTCFFSRKLFEKKKIPFVAFIHDPISFILPKVYRKRFLGFFLPILLPIGKYLDKWLIEKSKFVITQSSIHKGRLERIIGKKRKVFVVHNSIDSPLKKITKRKDNFMVSMTKWDFGKNPFLLLKIIRELKKRSNDKNEIKLLVLGDWINEKNKKKFLREVKKKKLNKEIKVLGYVAEEKMKEYLKKAKFLIHPVEEAFGMSCLEAAASGCTFIIPSKSGVLDLFEDGKECLSVNQDLVSDYVKKIEYLLDGRKYIKFGELAYKKTRNYTWRNNAKKIIRLLNKFQ